MSTMYFAKLNFNSQIYEVYDDESLKEKLLNQIFQDLSEKVIYIEENKKYKFITLEKNTSDFSITGRIVLVSPGVNISYDEVKDDVIEQFNENNATYVTFYFDLKTEEIAFVPKRDFGHQMFISMFKTLLEKCVPDIEVELYLEKNINQLREKIMKFANISIVDINIVPPNGDKEDFDALFSTKSDEIKETWATKFSIRLGGTAKKGINIASKYLNKMIVAVSKGYGEMKVTGKDNEGVRTVLTSSEEAPFTKSIPDLHKDSLSEIPNYAKSGIAELTTAKSTVKIE
ncbi:DUF4747 family protein [Desulfallas sp. Bu1-1]|uniref:DUF4747 family protein n=1 Tax=Desulfallas sp. Bu1-1 TaxID=2787620 RepID=UPI00189D970F|nr:DUF4747 family protein [Desulfallas sp. Bu1-1]MBF7081868.1 DUF4747 family protein [Desulfallas sp. Bu1-1]